MTEAIAITLGDPAGIGPEIIAKAFRDAPDATRGAFVAGDVATMRQASQALAAPGQPGWPVLQIGSAAEAATVPARCIPVLQVIAPPSHIALGQVSAEAGRVAGECVVWAARAALRGEIGAIVTAPLHKEALSAAGFPYPGHTELLQAEAAAHLGRDVADVPVRMMLANDELRTVLVSIHMSLRHAIEAVRFEGVLQTLRITHRALTQALGRVPRIGVAGLNPHAGEGGLFGLEEREIIAPAIEAARAEGIDVSGPYAPDTVFMRARAKQGVASSGEFDVVVAMYHDQGLIPVKYLGVEKGVNVTLGLPLVRTSPDHGTAFDIVGTGRADASSLVEALRMARVLKGG
ncbi:4-hydroxythreonine-4-phosphate dehydrogenase PdxA [Variovorax sp. J22G73]|uniref:4-hydroxythreonine-4-phosphate dehydrogenase PdxA n=1 Tax=unclassified Variovorax TaxID=663243 RepID=UPI0025778BB1|nr:MULTISPECIES: 4-hydroxythreonine-4-phosphate dehydrogenase PdxA [unclassified Variovorax]MDM0004466.1 4-hydroxythreonine-4-phosphate dehydrogenase PdxA [Variovorax sp. J22R203]MDM0095868.1 4-hydroxythreonine-4-phosphate dehydrogenase PdxA [Variovorax sp. J22G73]